MSFIRLLVAAGLLCSAAFVRAACDAYDLETVYGAYGFMHSVTDFHYAIDTTTFDMVVGGTIARVDASTFTFLYYVDDASCSVSWHYLIEGTTLGQVIDLSINRSRGRVYGLISNMEGTAALFMEIRLQVLPNQSPVIDQYAIAGVGSKLLVPESTPSYAYITTADGLLI